MSTLKTSAVSMASGADAASGIGQNNLYTFGGVWKAGDRFTLTLTDALSGLQTQIGYGPATGQSPVYCRTFNQKLYFLAGTTAFFSELDTPNVFNDPNGTGNSFIEMANQFGTPENLLAIAPYQGKLAFIARRTVQVFTVDPDPANYAKGQVLTNIGTVSGESVQAIGDMDVLMLADNGVRSIRVRDASNNAVIADVGTPIDAIVQPLLASLTDAQKAAACSIVEPSSNRYWVYIPKADGSAGKIYVFSYFSSSGIAAWSTYSPSYQLAQTPSATTYPTNKQITCAVTVGQTYAWIPGAHEASLACGATTLTKAGRFTATSATVTVTGTAAAASFTGALSKQVDFVPTRFCVFNGQVYARAGEEVFLFGGTDNGTYEACGVTVKLPYLSADAPSTRKMFTGMDAAIEGSWSIGFANDYDGDSYTTVLNADYSTFRLYRIPLLNYATHFSMSFSEVGAGYARFSGATVQFKDAGQK